MIKRMMFALAVAVGVTVAGFADEMLDVCFQFQTLGDDCYADGTMLDEGECYALVWRHNDLANSIDGLFDYTGKPVNSAKCEILGVFNTAARDQDEGHQFAAATNSWIVLPKNHYSTKSSTGVYSVFVFDTRTWDGQKWVLGGKTSDTAVASLRRYGLVTDLEDIKLGTGVGGTFFSYNVGMYGTAFVGNPVMTSTGDSSVQYSCADTPTVNVSQDCSVAFDFGDGEVSDPQKRVGGQPFGELPTPEPKSGFVFLGWFTTGDVQVTPQTIVTGDMKLTAHWAADDGRIPLFSSVTIANGKAVLTVTNTSTSVSYGISRVNELAEIYTKTNFVGEVKQGQGDRPLTWEIDLQGQLQGFFRILRK